ncbi:hypothetical protein EYR40_002758 [Pleurotus pulmonarius]|nr:hypothetical protein EYR40_002758 [Pleurotus pulmonarius]KAF4582391.1 hypothetical protein EYR38_002511 [Pleurotus pulmonarius]
MDDTQDIFPPTPTPRILDRTHGQHLQNTAHLFENPQALSRPHSQPRHSRSLGTSTLNETGQGSRPLGLYDISPTQADTECFPSINKAVIEHSEAYMRLNHANLQLEKENMRLRGENGALREDYAGLLDAIKNHQVTISSNTSPIADSIEIQKTAASFKRADMQSIHYWTWDEYTAAKNLRKNNRNETATQEKKGAKMLWFIETADGEPIKEELAKAIRRDCRMFWNGMNNVPARWGRADLKTHSEFCKVMSGKYPELTYCEGSWKLDQIASMDYPSWHNNYVANRVKTEPRPDDTTLKRSASPTTTFAKRHCTSPPPIPSSLKQKGRALFDNPLSGLFSSNAVPTPSTGRAISPLALEFMGQLGTPSQGPLTNEATPLPNELAPAPLQLAILNLPLGVIIPRIPYTSSSTAASSSVPLVSTLPEGIASTSDIVKKPRKARRPPPHSTKPKSVIKSWWMDKHSDGTEKEFTAYWDKLGLEGQRTALLEATLGPEEKEIDPSTQ